jgi:membrane glycosyltransferase
MMVIQTGSVMQIIFGRDTGWNPQRRDDGSIPLRDIIRRHRSHVALGIVTLIAGLLISPSLVAWMSPTIAGLILAIAISWASGQLFIGLALKRAGLLLTPEESAPPDIAIRANALASQLAADGHDESDGIRAIHTDQTLRACHDLFLPPVAPRRRGQIEPERAIAIAKLNDAETLQDAVDWLKPKERMVVLHDRALIDMITRLPATAASEKATGAA